MDTVEDQLLTRATAGDEDALAELLRRCGPQIRRGLHIAPKWRGVVDDDDVMQVTYMEAFLQIRRLEQSSPNGFVGWLRRIAENNLRDAIREQERDKRSHRRANDAGESDSRGTLLEQIAATTTSPSRAAGRREVQAIVDDVLEKLPPLYTRVLRLCDLDGKSGAEAATALGRSHGAVRMLLARARERLKEALGTGSGLFSDGP